MKNLLLLIICITVLFVSCYQPDPNKNQDGVDIINSHLSYTENTQHPYKDTVYIPIYSDIYSESRLRSTLLTATLSIRSTSLEDTTYVNNIDYYNTNGELVKSFIDKTLILAPMQSIDYVIEKDDTSGGVGANFIVIWGAENNTAPLFQAVMIGTSGQHGLSFVTNGVSTKKIK